MLATMDPIAERVRKIGAPTLRSIGDIGRHQSIKDDDKAGVGADAMIANLAADNEALLAQLKATKDAAEAAGDIAPRGPVDGGAGEDGNRTGALEAESGGCRCSGRGPR